MCLFVSFLFVFIVMADGAQPGSARKYIKVPCPSGPSCILPCLTEEALSDIMWSKGSFILQSFPKNKRGHVHRNSIRTALFYQGRDNGNCSLAVHNTTHEDTGIYKCETTSQSGKTQILYVDLQVHVPVEEVNIEKSEHFLICSSKRVFPKPECQWAGTSTNSTHAFAHDDQLYSINCTSPLLQNVTQNCTVSTPFSSKTAFYTQLPQTSISGTNAVLSCASPISPGKTVVWKFNHIEIIVNQSQINLANLNQGIPTQQHVSERWKLHVKGVSESGALSLENLTSHYQGLYTCVTKADGGTSTATTELNFKEDMGVAVPAVITAVVITVILTLLSLKAYKRKESSPDRSASESQANPPQNDSLCWTRKLAIALLGLGSSFLLEFCGLVHLYLHRHTHYTWILSLIVLFCHLTQLISTVVSDFCCCRFSPHKHNLGCFGVVVLSFVCMVFSTKLPLAEEAILVISLCGLWLVLLFSLMADYNWRILGSQIRQRVFALGQSFSGILASVVMIICVACTEDANLPICCYIILLLVSLANLFAYWGFQCHFNQHFIPNKMKTKEVSTVKLSTLNKPKSNNDNSQSPDGNGSNWNGKYGFSVAVVQFLTSCMWPSLTADVHSRSSGDWGRFFILVCGYLIFNCFNWIFKWFGHKVVKISTADKHSLIVFLILVSVYAGFIPGFIAFRTHLSNDVGFTAIMIFFSLLRGLLMLGELKFESCAFPVISMPLWEAMGGTVGVAFSFALRAVIQSFTPSKGDITAKTPD